MKQLFGDFGRVNTFISWIHIPSELFNISFSAHCEGPALKNLRRYVDL